MSTSVGPHYKSWTFSQSLVNRVAPTREQRKLSIITVDLRVNQRRYTFLLSPGLVSSFVCLVLFPLSPLYPVLYENDLPSSFRTTEIE